MQSVALPKKIMKRINQFVKERNWERFHSPKNLSMALIIECAELGEILQWKECSKSEKKNLSEIEMQKIKEEIGDIFIYFLMICERLEIDFIQAAKDKIKKNEKKYPIDTINLLP